MFFILITAFFGTCMYLSLTCLSILLALLPCPWLLLSLTVTRSTITDFLAPPPSISQICLPSSISRQCLSPISILSTSPCFLVSSSRPGRSYLLLKGWPLSQPHFPSLSSQWFVINSRCRPPSFAWACKGKALELRICFYLSRLGFKTLVSR